MKVRELEVPGVLLIEPEHHTDTRGLFFELWQRERYRDAGLADRFVQDNVSHSRKGVLRGLHFQHPGAQGKLVTALRGAIFDVGVDVRHDSPTFGQWVHATLDEDNGHQLYLPPGFAHGFQALTDGAIVSYKCTAAYDAASERAVRWDDPELGIPWPISGPVLSEKDRCAGALSSFEEVELPTLRDGAEGALG